MPSGLWEQCLSRLEIELSAREFATYLRPLQAHQRGHILYVLAPNSHVRRWVEEHVKAKIMQFSRALCEDIHSVVIDVNAHDAGSDGMPPSKPNVNKPGKHTPISPTFTFESFVEGKSNQIARAAALRVADAPGADYNPLFLYGETGLGKTHLMGAIGNKISADKPDTKVLYVSSERFVRDMVTAIRQKASEQFRSYYRDADILLIDDIQFLAGKDRSQEEFFHTFNVLHERQKQVVLTCDRLPIAVEKLDKRLQSRFGRGMTIIIDPPELEERVAILIKKAEQNSVSLPEEVAFFIAERIQSNVRNLEGALTRVLAFSNFKSRPLSIDIAREALKDLLRTHGNLITLERIQKTVAEYFKVRALDLVSKTRTRSIARPRQIAMSLSKELTNHSLPEIGEAFGGRDHTTVIHACRKVADLKSSDNRIAEDYRNLLRILSS